MFLVEVLFKPIHAQLTDVLFFPTFLYDAWCPGRWGSCGETGTLWPAKPDPVAWHCVADRARRRLAKTMRGDRSLWGLPKLVV